MTEFSDLTVIQLIATRPLTKLDPLRHTVKTRWTINFVLSFISVSENSSRIWLWEYFSSDVTCFKTRSFWRLNDLQTCNMLQFRYDLFENRKLFVYVVLDERSCTLRNNTNKNIQNIKSVVIYFSDKQSNALEKKKLYDIEYYLLCPTGICVQVLLSCTIFERQISI